MDLERPGWTVWQGQALWTREPDQPSVAGELLVARHADGGVLVSFSKPPIPIFTAQKGESGWRIDFVERGRSYSGRGSPPTRFIWFYLPRILDDGPAPGRWRVEARSEGELSVTHPRSGETVRVVLDP